ncbi:MAG: monovalent cation/H(+) antiporter subunit G [Defluviitaleaceae bacterium]|nr:monovalent cation/H(+) antiporter subunit G [Defluviitaleaceae bacterium]
MADIANIVGSVIIIIGVVFIVLGAFGIFKFKSFYPRMLVGSKVDTMGSMTIIFGIMVRHGFTFFSAKLMLIVILILVLNPLVSHIITKAAYESGHPLVDYRKNAKNTENKENTGNIENIENIENTENTDVRE